MEATVEALKSSLLEKSVIITNELACTLVACGLEDIESLTKVSEKTIDDCTAYMRGLAALFSKDAEIDGVILEGLGLYRKNPEMFTFKPGYKAVLLSLKEKLDNHKNSAKNVRKINDPSKVLEPTRPCARQGPGSLASSSGPCMNIEDHRKKITVDINKLLKELKCDTVSEPNVQVTVDEDSPSGYSACVDCPVRGLTGMCHCRIKLNCEKMDQGHFRFKVYSFKRHIVRAHKEPEGANEPKGQAGLKQQPTVYQMLKRGFSSSDGKDIEKDRTSGSGSGAAKEVTQVADPITVDDGDDSDSSDSDPPPRKHRSSGRRLLSGDEDSFAVSDLNKKG